MNRFSWRLRTCDASDIQTEDFNMPQIASLVQPELALPPGRLPLLSLIMPPKFIMPHHVYQEILEQGLLGSRMQKQWAERTWGSDQL